VNQDFVRIGAHEGLTAEDSCCKSLPRDAGFKPDKAFFAIKGKPECLCAPTGLLQAIHYKFSCPYLEGYEHF